MHVQHPDPISAIRPVQSPPSLVLPTLPDWLETDADEAALIKVVLAAANERKASSPAVYQLKDKRDLCNYHLVFSANTERQVVAIADAAVDCCRLRLRARPQANEGLMEGQWVILDFGNTLVHVFRNDLRSYYDVDTLWRGWSENVYTP